MKMSLSSGLKTVAFLLVLSAAMVVASNAFEVGVQHNSTNVQMIFPPATNDYYRAYSATGLMGSWHLTNMLLGAASSQNVNLVILPTQTNGFLRISRISKDDAGDGDGDGLDDVYELTTDGFDPLFAADATQDFDSDGVSNLAEYQEGMNPNQYDAPPQIAIHSPRDGTWLP